MRGREMDFNRRGQDVPAPIYPQILETILGTRDGRRAAIMMDLSSKEYAMRSYCARGVLLTLGMVCLAGSAGAQDIGSPSLLPISSQTYRTVPAAHTDAVVIEAAQGDNPAATDNFQSPDGPPVPTSEDYKQAMTQEWGGDVSCSQGVHGHHGCHGGGYWFGSVGGLILGSPTRHSTYLSYDSATYLPVLQTGQVTDQFSGGVDVTVGRMLGCGNWGAAFTYWGIYPAAQQADVYSTDVSGNLGSYINFSGLNYNANPAPNYWNNVFHHRIVTNQAINSVELNLLGNCGCGLWGCSSCVGCDCGGHCGPRLGAGWTMGVRYFQFNDDFRFYSDNADNIFDGSVNEIQYLLQTRNNLLGFQLGGGLNYRVWNCFSLYGIGKAGIYGNNAIVEQSVYGAAGDATVNVGPYAGTAFRISTSETNLAFLGQLDMGGSYQINNCWSIQGGYRMVGVTGLALTGGQIPSNFAYIPDAERVHSSDCLILHGGYVGATFCF